MTTNGEWLFSKPFDEQVAWMNAEHQDGTLDGDTAALNAKIAELERKLRISWEYECKFQDERDALQEQVDELTAERDNWKEHSRTIEHRCKKAETDCEIYRNKFGKCLDYADAIHALMDDEGIA